MFLLIDAGNSRLKIACYANNAWLMREAVDTPEQVLQKLPSGFTPQRILISNVAGDESAHALQHILQAYSAPIEWLQASHTRCQLRCDYADPSRLGPDRWAAGIAAWHHVQSDCLVVSAGTATTIDVIRAPGIFAGGFILPGLDLMLDSLASKTARLPRATGQLDSLNQTPTDTHAAISAGCLQAQLGAIERCALQLPATSPIILAGGWGSLLAEHFGARARLHPWLVMEGLQIIACSGDLNTTHPSSS